MLAAHPYQSYQVSYQSLNLLPIHHLLPNSLLWPSQSTTLNILPFPFLSLSDPSLPTRQGVTHSLHLRIHLHNCRQIHRVANLTVPLLANQEAGATPKSH